MQNYIGAKIIKAEPMSESKFLEEFKPGQPIPTEYRDGYHVVYPGEKSGDPKYHSWSPAGVFQNAYRPVTGNEMVLLFRDGEMEGR